MNLVSACEREADGLLSAVARARSGRISQHRPRGARGLRRGARAAAGGAGATVRRLPGAPTADHVLAEWPGRGPGILLIGHFDTVWPVGQIARMPVEERDGLLHGPGVLDMKAGLAIGITAGARARRRRAGQSPAGETARDERRGSRQRHIAGGDRAARARERGRDRARTGAPGRRGEDRTQGRRRVRARRARGVRPRRRESWCRRERDPRDRAPDSRDRRAERCRTRT